MAKYSKGILGPVRGTVGTVVGSSWRAIDYVRSKATSYHDRKSPAQVAQRATFKRHAACARGLLTAARVGLHGMASRTTEYNILVRRLFEVDGELAQLRLSSGVGPMVQGLKAAQNAQTVKVTWTPDPNRTEDAVYVAVVSENGGFSASAEAKQTAGEASFQLPQSVTVKHAYAFSANPRRELVSDTAVFTLQ